MTINLNYNYATDADSSYMTGYETKRKPSRSVFAPSQVPVQLLLLICHLIPYHGKDFTIDLMSISRKRIIHY